jgi:hypothetical protein
MVKTKVHKEKKDKKGVDDKVNVSELSPWPSYIEVCILNFCYMVAHNMIIMIAILYYK